MSSTVLITGASSGFGRATAERLATAGHRVIASMRNVDGRNRSQAGALRAKGIEVVEIDVTDDASVERGMTLALARNRRIDVLVNNAGIGSAGVSEAFTPEQMRALFDVNVFGVQRMLRAVLPVFRRQKQGLVINIGSILGRLTFPFFGLYGASKFALETMTESYRYELSQLGIDVVLAQPSTYPTGIFASAQHPADSERGNAYGEIGGIAGMMEAKLMETFQGADAPNPDDVAQAIIGLVEQAPGARPARVVVGQPFGADALNIQAAAIQDQVMTGLGLAQLARPLPPTQPSGG